MFKKINVMFKRLLLHIMIITVALTTTYSEDDFYVGYGVSYDIEAEEPSVTLALTSLNYFTNITFAKGNYTGAGYVLLGSEQIRFGVGLNYDKVYGGNAAITTMVYVTSYLDFVVEATPDNVYFKIIIYKWK